MSASNSRKALWPVWSVCSLSPKQSPADYAPCCAGGANKSTELSSHKLYLSQILVWFCGKNSFWKCLSKYQLWFPLLEDILWWGTSEIAERCLALTGQPLADKQLPKIRDLDHRGEKLVTCFSYSDDRLCVDMCVFIHVFLHKCRPTPCSVDVLQWIMLTSLETAEVTLADVAEIHSSVPPL